GTFGGPNTGALVDSRVINDKGAVVGVSDTPEQCPYFSEPISPGFMWKDGVLTNIGLLPGGCVSVPGAISSNGIIEGLSENGKVDPLTGVPEIRADVRINGRLSNLGTFGGNHSVSADVNSHGLVVGGAENKDPDPFDFGGTVIGGLPSPTAWRAFSWQGGKKKNLGTLGGPDSVAYFVNKHDEITGISFTNAVVNPATGHPTLAPFFWKHGRMQNIGSLGGEFGIVRALNNRSQVVGFSDLQDDQTAHAFVWAPDVGIKDLGTLGGVFSVADWINENREVVGGSST